MTEDDSTNQPQEPGFLPPPPPAVPKDPPPAPSQYPPAPPVDQAYAHGQLPSGGAPPGTFIDPGSGLALPVGTELASAGRRIGAFFLSLVLAVVTLGIGYIIWGLSIWGRGQTPALQVLGMRVWRPSDGRPATWGYMALREIVGRIVDVIVGVVTELVSFILMLTGKERKTLHDHVAGTVVLYDPNKVLAQV